MDNIWEISDWQPTISRQLGSFFESDGTDPNLILDTLKDDFATVEPAVAEKLIRKLPGLTKRIFGLPYDPTAWKTRGSHLCKLGYPELAASDAYKGILLCRAAIEDGGDKLPRRQEVLKHFGYVTWQKKVSKTADHLITADFENEAYKKWNATMTSDDNRDAHLDRSLNSLKGHRKDLYLILLRALTQLGASQDGLKICAEGLRYYPGNKDLVAVKEKLEVMYLGLKIRTMQMSLSAVEEYTITELGATIMKKYPWIPSDMLDRNSEVIAAFNKQLSEQSSPLEIRPSNIGGFGMFAKQNISAGDVLMLRRSPLCVSTQQMKLQPLPRDAACYNCCEKLTVRGMAMGIECCSDIYYCSQECMKVSAKLYHDLLHGKDYRPWYEAVNITQGLDYSAEFERIVFLRMLLVCVTVGGHPLKNAYFGGLEVPYGEYADTNPVNWSLEGHVAGPIKILQDLGVDVFANPDYDAWVLEHLWHRKVTNAQRNEDTDKFALFQLDPLYNFFNHSCEYPTMVSVRPDLRDRFFASIDISKDQEVFNCYLPAPMLPMLPKMARQAALECWMPGGKCKCTRCRRES